MATNDSWNIFEGCYVIFILTWCLYFNDQWLVKKIDCIKDIFYSNLKDYLVSHMSGSDIDICDHIQLLLYF